MLWASLAWARSVEVPGDEFDDIVSACNDHSVSEILVSDGAEHGGQLCSVSRDLAIRSEDGVEIPPVAQDSAHLELEGVLIRVPGAYPGVKLQQGSAELVDVEIQGQGSGATGLYAWDCELVATGLELSDFSATAAMELFTFNGDTTMSFEDCHLHDNANAVLYAQASNGPRLALEFTDCVVEDNIASSYGNLQTQGAVELTVKGGEWLRNEALLGGALHLGTGGTLFIEEALFEDNEASAGGAVYAHETGVIVQKGSRFANNHADGGGALYLTSGSSATVRQAVFTGNTTKGSGGALLADLDGPVLDIADSQFCGNEADNTGDGLWMQNGSLVLDHVLLQEHPDEALYASGMSQFDLDHLSVVGNGTGLDPGIGTLMLHDSLFWANSLDLASFGDSVTGTHNAFAAVPVDLGNSSEQLEITDPGFVDRFDPSDCGELPFLKDSSVLRSAASDGTEVGAFPVEEVEDSDSAWEPGDSFDSALDSPGDSPSDSQLDSAAPEAISWVSGGCGGGSAPAWLLVILGAWALQSGTNSSGPRRSSRK